MKLRPINYELVSHPMNWLTIWLMLIIAGAIGHYVLQYFGIHPAGSPKSFYGDLPAGQVPSGDAIAAINPATAGLVQ